jgi:hypothetical protein
VKSYTISGRLTVFDQDGAPVTWEDYSCTFSAENHNEALQLWTDVDSEVDAALSSLLPSASESESMGEKR